MSEAELKARLEQLEADNERLRERLKDFELSGARPWRAKMLRSLLLELPVLVVAFDEKSNIIFWNRECERITGFSASKMEFRPESRYFIYPNRSYRRMMFREWMQRGGEWRDWEWQVTCRDGTERTVSWSNISGRVKLPRTSAWLIGVDVTERNRAQRELHKKHALINALVDNVPEMMFFKDLEHRYQAINASMVQQTGVSRECFLSRDAEREVPFDLYCEFQRHDDEVLESRNRLSYDAEVNIHNEPHVFSITKSLCADESGVLGIVGTARDVTEERRAQQEAAKSNQQLQAEVLEANSRFMAAVEHVPIAVLITRQSDGEIRFANRYTSQLLGAENLVGQRTPDFYYSREDRDELVATLKKNQTVSGKLIRVKTSDETERWAAITMYPITYEGTPCILGFVMDASEQKAGERLLRERQSWMERLLEWHDQDRQLISFEIHDGIVQDMTGALLFLESVNLETIPPDNMESLGNAKHQLRLGIDEARVLINGLRPPALEEHGVVYAVALLAEDIGKTHSIDIDFRSSIKIERLAPAVEVAIYRIVQEALNNVWKHSQSKRAAVSLSRTDNTIVLTIQDWGIGFDPSQVKRRRHGLAGIRQRSKMLGGTVTIDSQPGAGARIRVEFSLENAVFLAAE